MNGGFHMAVGAGSAAAVLYATRALGAPVEPVTIGIGAIAAGVGALMPDMDHPSSTASRGLPRKLAREAKGILVPLVVMGVVLAAVGGPEAARGIYRAFAPAIELGVNVLMVATALFVLSWITRMFTGHRGATHSIVFTLGASMLASVGCAILSIPVGYGLLFGWGWATHLMGDALTPTGLTGLPSLLWPLTSATTLPVVAPAVRIRPSVPDRPETDAPAGTTTPASVTPRTSPASAPRCVLCGAPMVIRTAKRGSKVGSSFYGCSNFPRCRGTRKLV